MYLFVAQAIGFVAMALAIGSYQVRDGRRMILCKMASDLIYIVHYLMLGAFSGCVMLLICAFNGFVCSYRGRAWSEWRGWRWTLCALLVAANALTTWRYSFDLVPDLCALVSILGCILSAWTGNPRSIRITKLCVIGPTWLIYSFIVGSYSGILSEAIGITSAATALIRAARQERREQAEPGQE